AAPTTTSSAAPCWCSAPRPARSARAWPAASSPPLNDAAASVPAFPSPATPTRSFPMRQALLLILPAALMLAACQPQAPDEAATPPAAPAADTTATAPAADPAADPAANAPSDPAAATAARATLAPTEGNEVAGTLEFASVDGGIRITGQVTGLPAGGEHGFH